MDFPVELLLEFLIQIVGEVLAELGLHAMKEPFRREPDPRVAALGHALLGLLFGGISLLPFPHHMVAAMPWRRLNLVLTPVAAGACMAWIGSWRARRGQAVFRIDRFSYGTLFALCFAIVRFLFAT